MEKVRIIVIEPSKQPYVKEIKNNIDSLYGLVYYPYEQIELEKNTYLIYSKETENNQFPLCRKLEGLTIFSNFVIVEKEGNKFISLSEDKISKYSKIFKI